MRAVCHYFAYGSNMNPERVASRGLRYRTFWGAVLDRVMLTFDKSSAQHPEEGHANLSWAPAFNAEGICYELDSVDEIAKMDPFERAPVNYGREVVFVRRLVRRDGAEDAPTAAWTYFANAAVRRPGLRPSAAYLAHLQAGGPYLTTSYAAMLDRIVCHE